MKTYQCQKCDEIGCTLTLDSCAFDPTVCPFDAGDKVNWEKGMNQIDLKIKELELDALIRISETSQNFIGEVAGWFDCEEARKMHEGQRALTEWLKSLRGLIQ